MLKKHTLVSFFLIVYLLGCKQKELNLSYIETINDTIPQKNMPDKELKTWYFNDIMLDSLPGLSLNRAYDSIIPIIDDGEDVIVAIIDMPLDINHEDLKQNIWINSDEIPDNKVDDDSNGYVDDINGWNFISSPSGEISQFVNYEYTRIIRDYELNYKNKAIEDSTYYFNYLKAKKKHVSRYKYAVRDTARINLIEKSKKISENNLSKYFKNRNYSIKDLDSLKERYPKDDSLQEHIKWTKIFINYGFDDNYIVSSRHKAKERFKKLLNTEYNDRIIIGDNPNDINDKNYGSPHIDTYNGFFDHGTIVAGLIAARRDNEVGAKGISDNIKIMSLCISAFGDEHDKDIALAIRYAVDNGAKVINMSYGKEFSLHKQWVFDAIKYAEEKNVLIVTSAGNSGKDFKNYEAYPNDYDYKSAKEVADNFILVGASTNTIDEKLLASFSNYGASQVDVFAPGLKMNTTIATEDKYAVNPGGTSTSAAVTSGVAALVRSYYPNLTASQVKHIIMDSGVEYTFNVKVGDTLLPFNSLSKSGKIVNAYNALIMADSISKVKQ